MITLINHQGLRMMSGFSAQAPVLPIGLAYIAAMLKEKEFEYCVIDACGEALDRVTKSPLRHDLMIQGLTNDEVLAKIPPQTDIIGLTCMFSSLWPLVRELARDIKSRFPDVLIVLGGEHGTALPEHALASGVIDVCVLGEGEETFLRLIQAHRKSRAGGAAKPSLGTLDEDGRSVIRLVAAPAKAAHAHNHDHDHDHDHDHEHAEPAAAATLRPKTGHPLEDVQGIAYLDKGEYRHNGLSTRARKIDDIPWPDWDSFPVDKYIKFRQFSGVDLGSSLPILGTRGCPYKCTFCTSPEMWTTRWISRDPVKLVDEMEYYKKKYGLEGFAFMDLTFVINRKTTKAFGRELIKRDLSLVYQLPSGTRCEGFDDEVAELLYKSGLRYFAFAPESGSERIRAIIKKQVDIDELFGAIRSCLKQPLFVACYNVIGFPEDDKESIKETLHMIRRLAVVGVHDVAVNKFTPYPGSAQFRKLVAQGKISLTDEYFLSPLDTFANISRSYCDALNDKQLYRTMMWMYLNFYVLSFALRPWRVVKSLVKYLVNGVQDTKYVKVFADKLFIRRKWNEQLEKKAS